ncbi:hypothetical protein G9A89_014708 [Geosiphon pyriformis]|nr:hypothetical protein G9A89_014708 [Geosiphon pyriformis]
MNASTPQSSSNDVSQSDASAGKECDKPRFTDATICMTSPTRNQLKLSRVFGFFRVFVIPFSTLCLARKMIDPSYYGKWNLEFREASTAIIDREKRIAAVCDQVETNLTLDSRMVYYNVWPRSNELVSNLGFDQ